jgi:hypothetical protein
MLVIHIINRVIYVGRGDQLKMKQIDWHDLRELLARWLT